MGLQEIQERHKKKKRKRRRRILTMLLLLLLTGAGIFFLKSPMFQLQSVTILGPEKIPEGVLTAEVNALVGQNILLADLDLVKAVLESQAYFDQLRVERKFPQGMVLVITERKAEVNYLLGGINSLLTREGILLEVGANRLEEGLTLLDEKELPPLGQYLYADDPEKAKLLASFRDLQERNVSTVAFQDLDLRDLRNLKTHFGNLEIRLGYPDSLQEKLNAAINIIEGAALQGITGYIDLADLKSPVVFDEQRVLTPAESPSEPLETPQN